MDWFTGIVAYILIWWTALFAVLPWGNRLSQHPVPGQPHSAPDVPRLKQKFIITTILSAVIWLCIFLLVRADIIDFRMLAGNMMMEDTGL
jgi:predicted secreted protein